MGNSYSDDNKPFKGISKPFVNSLIKPVEMEIIIKCSVEEMTKAFFKDYVIVWHDPNVTNKENQEYITKLKKFCEVFTLTEWEKASAFVKETTAVCHVITSGTNGELFVKEVSESENVCNIYVFCRNKEYHENWAKSYPKISCVETHIQRLFNQIQQNLLEWYKKASSLNYNLPAFAPIFNDSDKSEMNHLHRYLKVIPNFKKREQAKEDFLSLSKTIYTDPNNQGFIADFEKNYNEYNKDQTLRWYTLESFLYKVTNNCLRIATSDSIQYCRLALKDIEQAIKDQYHEKSKNFNGLLYRGAYLSQEEWSSLEKNQDKEIEMHGFLSVSKVKNVALNFMNTDPSKKVFITIIVPKGPNEEEQGFAEIKEYSQYPQEEEILFNVRSRFTVLETEDDYEYSGGTSKCRHLVLLYGAQGFRRFLSETNPVQDVLIPSIEDPSCAHCHAKSEKLLFTPMAEGQKQEDYYCRACIDYGVGPFLCAPNRDKMAESHKTKIKGCLLMNSNQNQTPFYGYKCCSCQAKKHKSYFTCTDCGAKEKRWCEDCFEDKALDCIEAGHNTILETSPFSFWCEKMSATELNHLDYQNNFIKENNHIFQQAQMYFEGHKYEKAIEYYTLYIEQNESKDKNADLATSYNNLGTIYYKQGEYNKALRYYFRSLDMARAVHGENHSSVASTLHNIGVVYNDQGEYKNALEYHLKSLEIRKSIYGDNHSDVGLSYNQIGLVYNNQGDYNQALEYHLKSLDVRKSVYGDSHPLVATAYSNIGGVYSNQGDYKNALENKLKSLDIRKSVHGEKHPDVALSYHQVGLVYKDQGEYQKALEYFLKSLDIQKSIYRGDNHPETAASYNSIGMVYDHQGEYNKALEFYMKSLDSYRSVYGNESNPDIARAYNNIASVYSSQGDYEKALEYFFKCLNIQKVIYGSESNPDVAIAYNNIASVYSSQGDFEKALGYLLKSLNIYKSVYGDNHPNIATAYSDIASLYMKQKDMKKGLEYSLKTLDVYKSIYGDNHPDVASLYNDIGTVYRQQGENKKALECYFKSLEIKKSIGEDNHLETAMTYNNVGDVYFNQGEYKKALEYYLRCLDIRRSVGEGENHPDLALTYNNLGAVYCGQQEYDKALEYLFKSLDIYKSAYGEDNHLGIATTLTNIASVYRDQGEFDKAFEYFFKSLDIYKSVHGENHALVASAYSKIASVYDKQGEAEKAVEYLLKSLEVKKSIYGENHAEIVTSYNNIGLVYQKQGEVNKAMEYSLKSLAIQNALYGSHPDVGLAYSNIASVYSEQGEYEKALECYLKALDIFKSLFGENHSDVATLYNDIASLYRDQGDYNKAVEYYLKCVEIDKSVHLKIILTYLLLITISRASMKIMKNLRIH